MASAMPRLSCVDSALGAEMAIIPEVCLVWSFNFKVQLRLTLLFAILSLGLPGPTVVSAAASAQTGQADATKANATADAAAAEAKARTDAAAKMSAAEMGVRARELIAAETEARRVSPPIPDSAVPSNSTPRLLGDYVPCLMDKDQIYSMRGMAPPPDPGKKAALDESKRQSSANPELKGKFDDLHQRLAEITL